MIKFNNVSFSFDDKKILDSFSYSFEKGKTYVLIGESGIGKTTFLKLAYGLLNPSEGTIDRNYQSSSYIFDLDNLFKTTVINNLLVVSKDLKKIDDLLNYFKVEDLKNKKVSELSNGQRRRISIIRGLLVDADIYFIDEAIRGLDEENRLLALNKFKDVFKDKTVIYVTHNLDEVEILADEVIKL